jgi:CDP-glucose 4,6-dehydratase
VGVGRSSLEDVLTTSSWSWSDKRVLVTGAGGLLGGWVCNALSREGAHVTGIDLRWIDGIYPSTEQTQRVDGDIRDAALLERVITGKSTETVIHLAAQSIVTRGNEDPASTFDINIRGTWALLEVCRATPLVKSIVVASSDKAYGEVGAQPYDEQTPLQPLHPYAVSKACADLIAQAYAATYGLPIGISRCGNLYGGGDQNWSRIIPGTIRSVLRKERPVIRSDGTPIRDYLYVEDGADAVLMLARTLGERPDLWGKAFNFAAEERHSVYEIVRRILELMKSPLEPVILADAPNEIRGQRVDPSRAREILGWRAAHSLNEGLKRTVQWYWEYFQRNP